MKHEITQGQYADFLNALTRDQQARRCTATTLNHYMHSYTAGGSASIMNRNTVRMTGDPGSSLPRIYTTATPDRACNWMTWEDGTAFADWAGLRPMTEMEFEKACRGPVPPVAGEYAWGTGSIREDGSLTLSGVEDGTETVTTNVAAGAAHYGNRSLVGGDAGLGPVRAGIFATNGADRVSAGASYWGIMELSGNLWERTVTIGNVMGRAFSGLHGDGTLSAEGDANAPAWPTGANVEFGFRGGQWQRAAAYAHVSRREHASITNAGWYNGILGFRAVRSAP